MMHNPQNDYSLFQKARLLLLYSSVFFFPLMFLKYGGSYHDLSKKIVIQPAIWLLFATYFLTRKNSHLRINGLGVTLLIWLLWSGISVFWSHNTFKGLEIWLHWMTGFTLFIIILNEFRQFKDISQLLLVSVWSAFFVSLIGLSQAFFKFHLIPQTIPPGSTFCNSNVAAQFIVVCWPLSLWLFIRKSTLFKKLTYFAIFLVLCLFLFVSGCRAAWLGMSISTLVGIGLYLLSKDLQSFNSFLSHKGISKLSLLVIIVITVGLVGIFLQMKNGDTPGKNLWNRIFSNINPKIADSEYLLSLKGQKTRFALWLNTVDMSLDHPFLGVGLNNWHIHYPEYHRSNIIDHNFSSAKQPQHSHNEYIQMLSETSIIGVFFFIAIILLVFHSVIKYLKSTNLQNKNLLIIVTMALTSFWTDAFFSFPLRVAVPPICFMILLSIATIITNEGNSCMIFKFTFKKQFTRIFFSLLMFSIAAGTIYLNVLQLKAFTHASHSRYYYSKSHWGRAASEAIFSIHYMNFDHLTYFILGSSLMQMGRTDESIKSYHQALNLHPNHINTLASLGYAYIKKGEIQKAKKYLDDALRIKPDYAYAIKIYDIANKLTKQKYPE